MIKLVRTIAIAFILGALAGCSTYGPTPACDPTNLPNPENDTKIPDAGIGGTGHQPCTPDQMAG